MATLVVSPSAEQTHAQGPMVVGSGAPVSATELDEAKAELEYIKAETGMVEPVRSYMDVDFPPEKWIFGKPPNYTLANLEYLKYKTKNHPEGSLEQIVENLVKTWEFERSHKRDVIDHQTINQERFRVQANDGPVFESALMHKVGNYNALLATAPKELYDCENTSWHQSHEIFHKAFPAFPWEVIKVYTGPPTVYFSWRHFGRFTGEYNGHKGTGKTVEFMGFASANVDENLRLCEVHIFFDSAAFLKVLKGIVPPEELSPEDLITPQYQKMCPVTKQFGSHCPGSQTGSKNRRAKVCPC